MNKQQRMGMAVVGFLALIGALLAAVVIMAGLPDGAGAAVVLQAVDVWAAIGVAGLLMLVIGGDQS